MEIKSTVSFGHHSILKSLWKQGLLPGVKKGFYGDTLTNWNVTLEHLSPYSKTHRSSLDNLVLASAIKNHARGSAPLWRVVNIDKAKEYLSQFKGIRIAGKFDGDMYIRIITRKLKNIGIDLEKGIISKFNRTEPRIKPRGRRGWRG